MARRLRLGHRGPGARSLVRSHWPPFAALSRAPSALVRGGTGSPSRHASSRGGVRSRAERGGSCKPAQVLITLIGHDLQLLAKVHDEGKRHRLNLDPVALVGDFKTRDLAREEYGDEVPATVWWQAERDSWVWACWIVVDVKSHISAADIPLKVVKWEPHALTQQPQQLRCQASRQQGKILNNLPKTEVKGKSD